MIHLILLSGGSGTRLWPLSNSARSKQFLKVLRDDDGRHVSMVQRVFSQIGSLNCDLDITIATCSSQKASIESQISGDYSLVLEPERRDTAPAIMLACENLVLEQKASLQDTVIVMPIDTYANQAFYTRVERLDNAIQTGESSLVLLGVKPTYPSEKYGYIIPSSEEGDVWPVKEFKEKPNERDAAEYIQNGGLWNCGVFAFKLSYVDTLARNYYSSFCFDDYVANYKLFPKLSFDYEVVENADSISVIPYSGDWKDLGTWNTLTEEMLDDTAGRISGIETCSDTHIINELGIPLVALGLQELVVVATPDGILVTDKHQSSYMKPYVNSISETRPMYEQRNWGEYRVLDASVFDNDSKSLTKELVVKAEKQLSYQVHSRRSEVWTVISGLGEIVLDGDVIQVSAHSIIDIPAGIRHSARAFEDLHIIEVQLGDTLAEEDIERFGNYWK